jgi:hypothetical protein
MTGIVAVRQLGVVIATHLPTIAPRDPKSTLTTVGLIAPTLRASLPPLGLAAHITPRTGFRCAKPRLPASRKLRTDALSVARGPRQRRNRNREAPGPTRPDRARLSPYKQVIFRTHVWSKRHSPRSGIGAILQ